jgi:hypothetical protein
MIKLLLSVAVLALAQPVPQSGSSDWPTYPCGSGTLQGGAAVSQEIEPGAYRVEMPGTLECSADPKLKFAVATFAPDDTRAYVYDGMLASYASAGSTSFHVSVALAKGQKLGVCLMPDPQTRLSCVLIDADSLGTLSISSLNPATTYVIAGITPDEPHPNCNTCWRLH